MVLGGPIRPWWVAEEAKKTEQPLVERGTVLPLGTYEDGTTSFAWPGLIAAPFEGMANFGRYGYDSPEAIADNARSAFDVAGGAVTGGLGVGLAGGLADNSVGIFGGRLAKTADHNALARAEKLAAEGAPREQIWNDTGWFQGVDGKWRFEIDDSQAQFTVPQQEKFVFNGEPIEGSAAFVFRHPELFKAYPELATIKTKINRNEALGPGGFEGAYWNGNIQGSANLTGGARDMLLHELTHGVQDLENFAKGGNPDFGIPRDLAMAEGRKAYEGRLANQDRPKTEDDLLYEQLFGPEQKLTQPWEELPLRKQLEWLEPGQGRVYKKLAGEAEARLVPDRGNLTPSERQSRPPWLDYDVPEADQIVRFGNSGPSMSMSNVRPPSGPWPETAGFDERLGAVRQTFDNPNDLYRLPLPFNKAAPEDRLPYRHDDLIDGKEATTKEVQIRDLLSWQDNAVRDDVRALTNPETRAGAGEPTVVRYRGNDQIVDGHHRLLADLLNGNDAATVRYIDSLYANSPTGSSVPLLQNALERAQPQGIRAYHGSPHDFDRFSLDKIGTGEGAQAYGHGLYFADSEDVARNYRDALSRGDPNDPVFNSYDLIRNGLPKEEARQLFQEIIDDGAKSWPAEGKRQERLDFARRSLEAIDSGAVDQYKSPGKMYEVNIKANPEDFLDWDKPLSQQSEAVRNALSPLIESARKSYPTLDEQALTGQGALKAYSGHRGNNNDAASQALRDAGIPGIKYLDGMSRGAGEGSSNYVVFDDSMVDILRKYANPPTASSIPLAGEAGELDEFDPLNWYPIRPLP